MLPNATTSGAPGISLCHTGGLIVRGLVAGIEVPDRCMDAPESVPTGSVVRRDGAYGRDGAWAFVWSAQREK